MGSNPTVFILFWFWHTLLSRSIARGLSKIGPAMDDMRPKLSLVVAGVNRACPIGFQAQACKISHEPQSRVQHTLINLLYCRLIHKLLSSWCRFGLSFNAEDREPPWMPPSTDIKICSEIHDSSLHPEHRLVGQTVALRT